MNNKMYLGYNKNLKANVYQLVCRKKMYKYLNGKVKIK